jgi:membrane protein implicated in regulation of membrane protease activity
MKRGKILPASIIFGIFSINLISAFYDSYSRLSLGNFLNEIMNLLGASTIFLGAIFIISFAFLYKILLKFFKENKSSAVVVAFVISFVLIYLINRSGFDFEGIFDYLGYSEGFAYIIVLILLFVGFLYLFFKIGFPKMLSLLGFILMVVTLFTDFFYEKGVSFLLGFFISLIGLWLWRRKIKKEKEKIKILMDFTEDQKDLAVLGKKEKVLGEKVENGQIEPEEQQEKDIEYNKK